MDMRSLTLKALLAWSVLLGVLPADRCVLKLAGVCACQAREHHESDCSPQRLRALAAHERSTKTAARSPLVRRLDHETCLLFQRPVPVDRAVADAALQAALPRQHMLRLPPQCRTRSRSRRIRLCICAHTQFSSESTSS